MTVGSIGNGARQRAAGPPDAASEAAADFAVSQRAFAARRLRLLAILGIVAIGTYAVSDGLYYGWLSPAVGYRALAVAAMALFLVLLRLEVGLVVRNVGMSFVVIASAVAFTVLGVTPAPP